VHKKAISTKQALWREIPQAKNAKVDQSDVDNNFYTGSAAALKKRFAKHF